MTELPKNHGCLWVAIFSGVFEYPPPPLQTPGLARDGLPGGGGRRSPSDGLPGGGGGLQGYFKANCGTLHRCKQREHV